MLISDWSSDVCSSDLILVARFALADLGLERDASGGGDLFVTGQARTDDHRIARRIAELNRGRLEAGGRSDEYDRLALEALDRRRRHADRTAAATARELDGSRPRSAAHTPGLQSLMRNSYAVFCLKNIPNTIY